MFIEFGAPDLVEEFRDAGGSRHRRIAVGYDHGRGRGRVQDQKILAAVPGSFLDQVVLDPMLGERQPDES
jgi:hypothetical protein